LIYLTDGDRSGVELTVLGKRRIQYEEELAHDPTNYDAWFSLARLEEDAYRSERDESEDGEGSGPGRVRETYERAVANVPPSSEKRWVAEGSNRSAEKRQLT
jgi:crooked neck